VVTTLKTELWPWTIAVDQGNNIYVTTVDQWDAAFLGVLYRITPNGAVSELAGSGSGIGHEDGIGNAARFASPTGLATDPSGNIFVADTSNNAIRKVTPAGVVTTFAGLAPRIVDGANGRFRSPTGMAVDRDGNVYVIDDYRAVRKVTAGGVVTTLAGSPDERSPSDGVGVDARFSFIRDLAVDEVGNVFVADSGHRTIRRISAQGIVTTIAGSAFRSGHVDANGTAAQFSFPQNLAVDRAGNIYVADLNALRKISPNGDVSTVAGVVGQRGTTDGVAAQPALAIHSIWSSTVRATFSPAIMPTARSAGLHRKGSSPRLPAHREELAR
jgi:sugar lactone lactonase YvrE